MEVKESSTNNDIRIALEIDHQNVEELEANDEEDVVLEGFSLEGVFLVIGTLITNLNGHDRNIFFGFMVDGDV